MALEDTMALEDFFTLSEIKDGLSTLARVEELISLMQKQRNRVVDTVGDAARQWSTVAGTLAATQNIDCLNHFVNLKGLCFLNEWLQEAQKWNTARSDNMLEELMATLLGTLERIPVDREQLAVTGIGITIQALLDSKSLNIKEKANRLFDIWSNDVTDNITCHDLGNEICVNNQPSCLTGSDNTECGITPSKGGNCEVICEIQCAATEYHLSNVTRYSTSSQVDTQKDVKMPTLEQIIHTTSSDSFDREAVANMNSLGSSHVSNSYLENISVIKETSVCDVVGFASAGASSSLLCQQKDADDHRDVSALKEVFNGMEGTEIEVGIKEGSPCKSIEGESGIISSFSGVSASLSTEKDGTEPLISCNFNMTEAGSCNSEMKDSQAMSEGVDFETPTDLTTSKEHQQSTLLNKASLEISCHEHVLNNINGPENPCRREEPVGSGGDDNSLNESNPNLSAGSIATPNVSSKAVNLMNQKSEMGLEEFDALEVARQVAIEVEREVVDYREPFCNSPEVNSGENAGDFNPEGNQDRFMIEVSDGNMSPSRKDMSNDVPSSKEQKSQNSDNICPDFIKRELILETQEAASVALESVAKSDLSRCDFDLNQDICTEEFHSTLDPIPNNPVYVSAPVAVLATSKGTSSLPATPLQFEGEMGWKGSAVTSAFQPASSRLTPDFERVSSKLKQKSIFLDIDLNVVEPEHDVAIDQGSAKQMPVSSGVPSQDSSIEVSSWRAERLKLDLNRLWEDDMPIVPPSYWRTHRQNGHQSVSSASSSSVRHPSLREFDLNDNPCLLDAGASHNIDKISSKVLTMYGNPKLDDPAITIIGSKMAMDKTDYVNQSHSFLGNGLSLEAGMAVRFALSYAHMIPTYSYNGNLSAPAMAISPPLYGPGTIPYMDPRVPTAMPHVLGSAGTSVASSMRPQLLASFNGVTPGINGTGPSGSCLDLNSGSALIESGSREGGSFKHIPMHGHSGSVEEQTRTFAQPSSSGASLKRKEPEYGGEAYPHGYKHATSWQ